MYHILNHNWQPFDTYLLMSDYWDFFLHIPQKGDGVCDGINTGCLSAYIDTDVEECVVPDGLESVEAYSYSKCKSNGITLNNIGFTGTDNGLITFDKNTITEDEFEQILKDSKYTVEDGDCKLKVHKVAGNNGLFSYDNEMVTEDNVVCARLNGGFFQGFFRIGDGCDYKVLPDKLGDAGWGMEFELKMEDFQNEGATLNDVHPDNKGIFFFMGTRAENKWIRYYDTECEFGKTGYDDENNQETTVKPTDGKTESIAQIDSTNDGHRLDEANLTEIESENKYLLFDRSCEGVTTETYQEGDTAVIQYRTINNNDNFFQLFSRSCDGMTVKDYDKYLQENGNTYDVYHDLYRNAFALQVKEDGSVGYKYFVPDCEEGDTKCKYKIESEWTNPGKVKYGEWSKIYVRILRLGMSKQMRVMIYVDGKLRLVSKELPEFNFRMLEDTEDKQEGVPFNISLGGGTQGLCDVIYNDFGTLPEYVYPLEKEFGGSFIGYFKVFRFYECPLNFNEINCNSLF